MSVSELNVVVLVGRLSSPPVERMLPSGDRLVQFELTTRDTTPASSVPVVWHDAPASAVRHAAGAEVVATGHVRRRFYRAGGATQSRTEVVADRVESTGRARAVDRLVDAALERLTEAFSPP